LDAFLEKYRSVKPYLITPRPHPEKERLQSPEEREKFDDTTKLYPVRRLHVGLPFLLGGW